MNTADRLNLSGGELQRIERDWVRRRKTENRQRQLSAAKKEKRKRTKRLWKRLRKEPRRWRYLLMYHYKRCNEGDIDGFFLDHLLAMQENRCAYCEDELFENTRVLEHMTPISRGGQNTKDNVCFACWDCNGRKYTKTWEEFVATSGV